MLHIWSDIAHIVREGIPLLRIESLTKIRDKGQPPPDCENVKVYNFVVNVKVRAAQVVPACQPGSKKMERE